MQINHNWISEISCYYYYIDLFEPISSSWLFLSQFPRTVQNVIDKKMRIEYSHGLNSLVGSYKI